MRSHYPYVRPTAGFSIVEMLVVLAIIASVAAISQPLLRGSPTRAQLQTTAEKILAALKESRAAAIIRDSEIAVVFDAQHRTLSSPAIRTVSLPEHIRMDLKEIGRAHV